MLPFDEIYLMNLVERVDRYHRMRYRIEYMGWDVKDFRVVKHPISDKIVNKINNDLGGEGFAINNGGVFNCTREHYTIIKSAYLRGLNTVGIIEDDCSFFKDKNVWMNYMENLPSDWNILRINCLRGGNEERYCCQSEDYWVPQKYNLCGTGFYVMDRVGMKYMIDSIDKCYQPIDEPLSKPNFNINIYIPKIELSLCLEDSFKSDIHFGCSEEGIHTNFRNIKGFKKENYI